MYDEKNEISQLFPFATERLFIRVATPQDTDLIQDAKEKVPPDILRRWMSWTDDFGMSRAGTVSFLTQAANSDCNIPLLGLDKKTNDLALITGLDANDASFLVVSTGWWLGHGYEGQGIAYEGMKAIIDLCHQHKFCNKIVANHYEGNKRSQALMLRLGFHNVGMRPKAHKSHLDGSFCDVFDYEKSPFG